MSLIPHKGILIADFWGCESARMTGGNKRLVVLDGLRGVAAVVAPIGRNAVNSLLIVALVFPPLIHMSSGEQVKRRLARPGSFLGDLS
jgi:hypothetical protein